MAAQTDTQPLANPPNNVLTYGYQLGGDSITMPDELDNPLELADTFATRSRMRREECEARLDALQKRWSAEIFCSQ
jgi:hypothetical protein